MQLGLLYPSTLVTLNPKLGFRCVGWGFLVKGSVRANYVLVIRVEREARGVLSLMQ